MSNLATKAPNFSPANAREMQRRATAARIARRDAEKARLHQLEVEARAKVLAAVPDPEEDRVKRTKRQIDRLDAWLDAALDACDKDEFKRLAAVKRDLWSLVQPTMGQLKPRRAPARCGYEEIQPLGPALRQL